MTVDDLITKIVRLVGHIDAVIQDNCWLEERDDDREFWALYVLVPEGPSPEQSCEALWAEAICGSNESLLSLWRTVRVWCLGYADHLRRIHQRMLDEGMATT